MALANVELTNTFDEWRTRTNQIIVQGEQTLVNVSTLFTRVDNGNLWANSVGTRSNTYADSVGVRANTYADSVGARANTYANSYANSVGNRANTYADSVGDRANTYADGVATRANTYADGVGTRANTYADSVGVRANTYADGVGTRANTYADSVGVRSNNYSSNASTLSSGTVPSARISGSYTGITGVGTITAGTWTGTVVAVQYGGTGGNDQATARTGLGLGTMSTQGSGAVSISGGSISGLSSLGVSGDITATGDVTAFSSDARLKGDIQTITNALSKVKLITGVTYIHNDLAKSFGYTDESRFAGVLAQEVEAVLPEVVVPAPFDIADDGTSKSGENYKTVKYEKIVPLLIEAIKELTAKVEMLESRVNE
jgi:hypothetical protein